jgi:lipoyl(octanoyl) transferase
MHPSRIPVSPCWRLLDTPPAPGAWNMAVDEALAGSVAAGGAPVLRFYRWDPPCLSLGRHQPADGCDRAAIARAGLDVVRRPSGGRAVLHARELTYSVAVAEGLLGTPRETYRAVNLALVAGLSLLGAPAALHGDDGRPAPRPSSTPCFEQPVAGEVVAGGGKLVGSAQRRWDGVLLQHGSLPFRDDQEALEELLPSAVNATARRPPATLAALLGRVPSWEEVTAALAEGWRRTLGVRTAVDRLLDAELERAAVLRRVYDDPAWTWHPAAHRAPAMAGDGAEP